MATIVNDKQILLKESNIEFYREDKCIGSGDLEITSKNIIWTNNNNNNNDNGTEAYETNIYFKFDFCDIMLHAISRDTEAFPKECIYTQIDDEDGNSIEIRFVPSDKLHLENIFQAFCEGARLNPDLDENGNVKTDNEALNGLATMLNVMAGMNSIDSIDDDNNNEGDLNNVEHNKKMLEKFDNMLQMNEDELL